MRLIDADALIKELHEALDRSGYDEDYKDMGIDDLVLSQKTVYDINKAEKELRMLKEFGGFFVANKNIEDYREEIRNKAIDDFIYTLEYDFGTDDEVVIGMYDLRETAKQLKENMEKIC